MTRARTRPDHESPAPSIEALPGDTDEGNRSSSSRTAATAADMVTVTLVLDLDDAEAILSRSRTMEAGQDQIAAQLVARGETSRLARAATAWGDEIRRAWWTALEPCDYDRGEQPSLADVVDAVLDELYDDSWRAWPPKIRADVHARIADEATLDVDEFRRLDSDWRCPTILRNGNRCRNRVESCPAHRGRP